MVLDSNAQVIYMFGGWDGTKDLSDFWSYNISEAKWKLISANTAADVRNTNGNLIDFAFEMSLVFDRAGRARGRVTKWSSTLKTNTSSLWADMLSEIEEMRTKISR